MDTGLPIDLDNVSATDPIGMADVAAVLWTEFLTVDPTKPDWADRDRLVLSSGHPGIDHAAGIETAAGPVGQELANAVGMALAERIMARQHGDALVNHDTYVMAGDGCLTGSISQEAATLAGRLQLGRLIVLLDDQGVSGRHSGDTLARFEAAGWDVRRVNGHDHDGIEAAIRKAKVDPRPSLMVCRTTGDVGGADGIGRAVEAAGRRGRAAREAWEARFMEMDVATRARFGRAQAGGLCDSWRMALEDHSRKLVDERPVISCLDAGRIALDILTQSAPNIIGGAADLGGSDGTRAAIMNGIAQHQGLLPHGDASPVAGEDALSAIRHAAMQGHRVIYVMAEDPSDQVPVERLANLRAIPNLDVMRPADAIETAECWALALTRRAGPTVLVLSRQAQPAVRTVPGADNRCEQGGYVLAAAAGDRALTILATGAEVQTALDARERLQDLGLPTAVISMPCQERFDQQPLDYRMRVLGTAPRVAIEAAGPVGWTRYVDHGDDVVAVTAEALVEHALARAAWRQAA